MSDDDFLNLGAERRKPEVIERTIHTLQTIRVYPNGEVYLGKAMSWLDKKVKVIKKKEKKAPIKVETVVLAQEESY